jgi:hypothetical protein
LGFIVFILTEITTKEKLCKNGSLLSFPPPIVSLSSFCRRPHHIIAPSLSPFPCRQHPQSTLRAAARRHGSRRWVLVVVVDVMTGQLAPDPPCEQMLTAAGVGCCTLAPPRTHQPSSLRAVARSRGVWCRGCHHLPLVPVVVLMRLGRCGVSSVVVVIFPPPTRCCHRLCLVGIPPVINPTSSCS